MNNEQKLKNCPFCGCPPYFLESVDPLSGKCFFIGCRGGACGALIQFVNETVNHTKEMMFKAWNRRA